MNTSFTKLYNKVFLKDKKDDPCDELWTKWVHYCGRNRRTSVAERQSFKIEQKTRIKRILLKLLASSTYVNKKILVGLMSYFMQTNFDDNGIVCDVLIRAIEFYRERDVCFRFDFEYHVGLTNMESAKKLDFFLRAATLSRFTVKDTGLRLQDYLLGMIRRQDYRRATWDSLYTLMRFGTRDLEEVYGFDKCIEFTTTYRSYKGITVPAYPLLDVLSSFFKEIHDYSEESDDFGKDAEKRYRLVLQFVKLAFRAIKCFPACYLPKCNGPFFTDFGFVETKMIEIYDLMTSNESGVANFPEFLERANREVTKLTHLCKYSVRKRLYENWQLPDGIYELNIPTKVKRYIDLKTCTI